MFRLTALVLTLLSTTLAIPTWEGYASRDSVTSLVPGAGFVQAIGPKYRGEDVNQKAPPKYLTVSGDKGLGGGAIAYYDPAPPMFFINPRDNQLYQVVNETTILNVNVVNVTATATSPAPTASPKVSFNDQTGSSNAHDDPYANSPRPKALPPLKLELSKKRRGIPGFWRWQGTMLIFETGSTLGRGKTNQGAFYSCPDNKGVEGIYLFLEPAATPAQCNFLTLHSWIRNQEEYKR
ncbi:hypothetical protein PUNSTDRAFT_132812 [Punctularia strigosozonata HHB-11173 SS5]|uniref:uncharacterized protein n=1 Tax=Punctularia strigosozonata (strain HHB-11173) TaxID=741275 RepID=UPI0004416B93|nr:uncharacterized protein PUNSTDRAFT_132812 [Punctularia strigosozonata HHB-11173 SS5]EIN10739.1 hypothetical protein PUNSTDRAFT_132812 [Punctularia strigosozonata HHB-11173 SS5]